MGVGENVAFHADEEGFVPILIFINPFEDIASICQILTVAIAWVERIVGLDFLYLIECEN